MHSIQLRLKPKRLQQVIKVTARQVIAVVSNLEVGLWISQKFNISGNIS